jgi:hypothetical protein
MTDLKTGFLLTAPSKEEDDQAEPDTEEAEEQEPKADIEYTLDRPAMLETVGVLGTLALIIGGEEEVGAVMQYDEHEGKREYDAPPELDPRLGSITQGLGVAVDTRVGIDRAVVAHPQRKDRRVDVPFQLLEFGERNRNADIVATFSSISLMPSEIAIN